MIVTGRIQETPKMRLWISILAGLLAVGGTAPAVAESLTLNFTGLSANNVNDVATGQAQLSVVVSDFGTNQVLFKFQNAGPNASSITDVYFEDGALLGIAGLIDVDDGVGGDSGVDFSPGGSPPNLPAGNNATPEFQVTAGFLADSDPPAQPNGVNPGEWLGVIFDLQSGKTFADIVESLFNAADPDNIVLDDKNKPVFDTSDGKTYLRIGIHVQGFYGGGSESFLNSPPPDLPPGGGGGSAVPEPTSFALLGVGALGALGFGWRRRRNRSA